MRRTVAGSLFGAALALLAGCAGSTRELEHTAAARPVPPAAAPARSARIQRDLYTRKLVYLLRQGWRPPQELDASPMSLHALIELSIDSGGLFTSYRLVQSSGDATFDASVASHMQALIDSGARAEHGPPYIVEQVFGELITVLFRGPPPSGTPPY